MSGYEIIRLGNTLDRSRPREPCRLYAEKLTPSGAGIRVASWDVVKCSMFQDPIKRLNHSVHEFHSSLEKDGWRPIPGYEGYLTKPQPEGASPQEYEYCDMSMDWPISDSIKYVAVRLTPGDAVFIGRGPSEDDLRSRCMSEGWESVAGEEGLFKRRVAVQTRSGGSEAAVPGNAIETLKKLGELRDTGVLTEEEFKAKKTDILGEML